jgi:hypothetical protein
MSVLPKKAQSNPVELTLRKLAERRRQIRGLLLLAAGIVVFSVLRKGLGIVFTPGWWRLW